MKQQPQVLLPTAKSVTLPDWGYACTSCGKCCRDWHVFLRDEDLRVLRNLDWGDADPGPAEIMTEIGGHPYVAHRENGACVYLDESTNLCRIHSRFGEDAKPLGCRVYPWNLATSFPGEYTAIPRLDCPPARRREGAKSAEYLGEVRGFVAAMGLSGGFDDLDLEGLDPARARAVVHQIFVTCVAKETNGLLVGRRLLIAADRLERLGAVFLNDPELADVLTSLCGRVNDDADINELRRMAYVHRWNFASLLAGYLRRDEELLLPESGGRVARAMAIAKLIFGAVNLRDLGKEHPDGLVTSRDLYLKPIANLDEIDWTPWLEMVRLRLQSYQFMGKANYGQSLYPGLRSLALTLPLILAAAKWSALARDENACRITDDDLDYAVGAIDHSYGRSAYLSIGILRKQARQLSDPTTFRNLLNALTLGKI